MDPHRGIYLEDIMKFAGKSGLLVLTIGVVLLGVSPGVEAWTFHWSGINSQIIKAERLPSPVRKTVLTPVDLGGDLGAIEKGGRIVVTSLNGDVAMDGKCSLPEAIICANTGLPPILDLSGEHADLQAGECSGASTNFNTIVLPEGEIVLKGPYATDVGLPPVQSRLLIKGKGISKSIVKRSEDDKVPLFGILFVNSGGDLTLQDLTVANGDAPTGAYHGGGAIYNYSGNLTLKNCELLHNHAWDYGGALYSSKGGVVDVTDSYFLENKAGEGGAIFSLGEMSISASSFYKNQAKTYGGHGGGVYAVGRGRIENSTIVGNEGEGVYIGDPSKFSADPKKNEFVFESVTIAANKGQGLSIHSLASVTIHNTLLAGNYGGDAVGPIKSAGYNVIRECIDCSVSFVKSDQIGTDSKPLDVRLGDATSDKEGNCIVPLLSDSPAVDHGDPKNCPATDQRDLARPQGAGCDVGAYEFPELFPVMRD